MPLPPSTPLTRRTLLRAGGVGTVLAAFGAVTPEPGWHPHARLLPRDRSTCGLRRQKWTTNQAFDGLGFASGSAVFYGADRSAGTNGRTRCDEPHRKLLTRAGSGSNMHERAWSRE